MTDKAPDQEKVEIVVDKLGHVIRAHIRAAKQSTPTPDQDRIVEAAREALNALAIIAAMTVSGAPTSAGLFDFFLAAFRTQIAAIISQKINPQPKDR